MATRWFQVILEWDSEAETWVTHVPVLDYLSTFGDSREIALANTKEAILGYLEAAAKDGLPVPDGEPETELVSVEIPDP